jgi:hypothetical protein
LGDAGDELGITLDVAFGKDDFDSDAIYEAFDNFVERLEDTDFDVLRGDALDLDRDDEENE